MAFVPPYMQLSIVLVVVTQPFSFLAVNLSMADTMVSSLNVTFNLVYMLNCQ